MRAINHAVTGALIAFVVQEPLLAAPLAVVSHFVCDAIPHSGWDGDGDAAIKSSFFKQTLYIDAALCGLFVLSLAILQPHYWLLAAICAFLAAAPDFMSFGRYIATVRDKPYKPNWFTKFAKNIQWFEHPIGLVVEAVWLLAGLYLLSFFVI